MSKISDSFQSSLFVYLKNKPLNDFSLDSTTEVVTFENPFALNSRMLVENPKDRLVLYRLKPLSIKTELACIDKLIGMIFIGEYFIYATDNFICISDGRKLKGDYKDVSLLRVGSFLGLQYPKRLVILDLKTQKDMKEIKASTSFYSHDVLLTSYDFLLSIYIGLVKKVEINLPSVPTCLVTDLLFTRVYCGQPNGDILCINLDGTTNRTLAYHKSKIVSLRFSFCQRFLYSADSSGVICAWEVEHNVVIDKIETGCEVFNLEVALSGSVTSEMSIPGIFKV